MRKLLYITTGFALGCGACAWFLPEKWRMIAAAVFLAASIGMCIWGIHRRFFRQAGLIAAGLAVSLVWFGTYQSLFLQLPSELDGITQYAVIRANEYAAETLYGCSVEGTVELDGHSYRVLTYLKENQQIQPAMLLSGNFRFRVLSFGERNSDTYYPSKGIFLIANQKDAIEITEGQLCWKDAPTILRQWIKEAVSASFPEDTEAFARALLLGDTSGLDYVTNTALKISGIRHVAAVSGLHVSILFVLLIMLTRKRRFLTAALGIPALFLFAALAGFSPSVNRACMMSGLMLLGSVLDREYDGPSALAFAVLVMLLCNPMAVCSVSLQLSVTSVTGILLFSGRLQSWLEKLFQRRKQEKHIQRGIQFLPASISISLSSCILSTPLCAFYFGTVSIISPLTNLLTLWAISLIFYGIMAACAVYAIFPLGAKLLGTLVSFLIRYVLFTAKLLAGIPISAIYTCSPYITAWLVFLYLLLSLFLLMRRKQPGLLAFCITISLLAALLASWIEPRLDTARMTVLDVGQGQCILLQSGGRTYMVDCGGDSTNTAADTAAEKLLSMGITRLDALILTHADADHTCGVENLLTRIRTDRILLAPQDAERLHLRDEQVQYVSEDLTIYDGSCTLTVFAGEFSKNSNDMSLCVLFEAENCDILITGDRSAAGERSLLANRQLPDIDVLIAGHHGSSDAVCEELLKVAKPQIVCISAGKNNRYGHPSQAVLNRLTEFGCTVYRTDLQGTITVRR